MSLHPLLQDYVTKLETMNAADFTAQSDYCDDICELLWRRIGHLEPADQLHALSAYIGSLFAMMLSQPTVWETEQNTLLSLEDRMAVLVAMIQAATRLALVHRSQDADAPKLC